MSTKYILKQGDTLKRFMLSGVVAFTCKSEKTGRQHTFRVMKKNSRKGYPLFFVAVLFENSGCWKYLGAIYGNRWNFAFTKSSKKEDYYYFKIFQWIWDRVGKSIPISNVTFSYSGNCCKCGRSLKDTKSLEEGIGPVCKARLSKIM